MVGKSVKLSSEHTTPVEISSQALVSKSLARNLKLCGNKGKVEESHQWEKKDPAYKTAPGKKASATRTESNAETENKKRPSLEINYNVLDKLFDADNSPKRDTLEKAVGDQVEYSNQSSEESLLKPQESEKEEPDWSEDYSKEDAYRGDEECYDDEDLEHEEEDDEGVIW